MTRAKRTRKFRAWILKRATARYELGRVWWPSYAYAKGWMTFGEWSRARDTTSVVKVAP